VLRALQVDAQGRPETRHEVTHFGTVAYDHTLPPLAARVVRYSFKMPKDSVGPLQVTTRVRHRRHRLEARQFACEATRSARGRAFIAEAKKRGEPTFDGCADEPISEVASAQLTLGEVPADARPTWLRLYDHALGLSLSVQEHLGEARWSAELAQAELMREPQADKVQLAMICTLLGRIDANQGRLDDALAQASQAEELLGEHPSVARVRADAYARVWRWSAAAEALTQLVRLAPGDTAAYRDLAKARFSAGDARGALQAAQAGMALQPRDETLLRVQTLALEAHKSADAPAARAAFLFYRDADESTHARMACDKLVPNCRRDRDPVVKIDLTTSAALLTSHAPR
jgi:tetratricopeptide (TPR) repeat protein